MSDIACSQGRVCSRGFGLFINLIIEDLSYPLAAYAEPETDFGVG